MLKCLVKPQPEPLHFCLFLKNIFSVQNFLIFLFVYILCINYFCPHLKTHGILALQPGIEPVPPALEVRSLNHWTAREVPYSSVFICTE